MVKQDSQQVIGYCGLEYMPDICSKAEVELAYRLARNFWGKGYATEACLAIRAYGLLIKVLGLRLKLYFRIGCHSAESRKSYLYKSGKH